MKNSQKPQKALTVKNNISKKVVLFFICATFSLLSIHAINNKSYSKNYGKSFIFIENNIEFSVFSDGQFDFNVLGNNSNINISINTSQANFSFNSGYNYNSYVQYDEYGAIIQIENIPIHYDPYGRIIQAGNVNVFYNNFGYISRIGSLNIYYNRYNQFSYSTGIINTYNTRYIYQPRHKYYCIPKFNYRVVYTQPYRVNYYPVRYVYTRPFINNKRPKTAIACRQGSTIYKNTSYATAYRNSNNRTTINTKYNYRKSPNNNQKQIKNNTDYHRSNNSNISYNQKNNKQNNHKTNTSKKYNSTKNPKNTNSRISNKNDRRSQLVNNSKNKPKTVNPSTLSKYSEQKTQRTALNRSFSSNTYTKSETRRTRF